MSEVAVIEKWEAVPVPSSFDRLPEDASPDFLLRVEEERELSDRSGRGFCVAVAAREEEATSNSALHSFLEVASDELRQTDFVCRLNDDAVGVLMPFTTSNEGQIALSRIKGDPRLPSKDLVLSFEDYEPLLPTEDVHRDHLNPPILDIPEPPIGTDLAWDPRGIPVLLSEDLPHWKRVMDILLAGSVLVLLSPLMALIAIFIKVTSPGPAIFKQWRTGRRFKPFLIYKFRTMRPDADRLLAELQSINQMSGPLFKSEKDPRILKIGKLLRKTSLDELPQLVNVLKGDMTLIGPRALSPKPKDYKNWQLRRLDVTPGLACSWQATRRADTNFDAWMRSDLSYLDLPATPGRDTRLLMRIAVAVLRCVGSR